ncbi:MAG: T9SS type A sorting domain-containing protein [Melioribacteraceae bacterium]|nr:T9SS type A sorting domain-containing protein [Melioribacteraceae bacterium]
MKKLLMLILFLTSCVIAQTEDAINVNNIYFPFNNSGVLADVNVPPFGTLAKFDNVGFLFSGGFFLSGYANDELFANGVVTASLVEDYQPGLVGSSPEDPKNIIYKISENSEPFGEEWIKWKDAVEQGAYFYDGDGDGLYDPIDKNGNGIWDADEDRPDILYDETYFTVFNDGVADSLRRWRVKPLGIEIGQTIFASSQNSKLSNTVFVRYSINNTGLIADTLKDVIFTFWQDPDVGDHIDDQFGVDTTLQSSFAYDDDNHDEEYGIPPAAFFTILQTPKTYTGNSNHTAINRKGPFLGEELMQNYLRVDIETGSTYRKSDPFFGDPDTPQQARNYAMALLRDGAPVDPCVSSFGRPNDTLAVVNCMDCNDVNPMFWFSGDPVTNCGWLGIKTTDIRNLLSTGTFNLAVNNPTDIIVAYTIDRGGDGMESITKTRERVSYLLEEYERNFSTIVSVDDKHEEVVNEFSLSQNYPNPFNPTTSIKYTVPNVGTSRDLSLQTKLIVYDILGREIKTLVNEVKSPGTYEFTFDASQLASGVYFYRLTSGSFMQTKKMVLLR